MSFPILPHPDFLSLNLQKYLNRISEQVGRYIVFCDALDYNPSATAWVETASDIPAAAIFVRVREINPHAYDATVHDSIIAHEVTHLQLYREGWVQLGSNREHLNSDVWSKFSAVHNWLTDPIVNTRIHSLGFSIAPNRNREIQESTDALRAKSWSSFMEQNKVSEVVPIRMFVSFLLEPNVEETAKFAFREAFRNDLPSLFEKAVYLLNLIHDKGFDTPKRYLIAAQACLDQWDVDLTQITFAEKLHYFSTQERETWANENAQPEDNWLKYVSRTQ